MDPEQLLTASQAYRHSLYVQLLGYLYPGTLFIPFLVEPVVMLVFPYYIGKWLVRSRPDIFRKLQRAEDCMSCPYFDLSRYGDILMNVALCSLMLYLAPVDVWRTFFYLTLSLLYIYAWDHYRFLRCTQGGVYADNSMDATAHYLCAVPCALIAGSLAVRVEKHYMWLSRFGNPWKIASAVAIVHLILHFCILAKIVPNMHVIWARKKKHAKANPDATTYKAAASHVACSWFNANPVHCLRSKYLYDHEPPCTYFVRGSEHLIQTNENVGIYFHPPARKQLNLVAKDLQ
eukprot:gnl/MRDRNA2_/MRDRNA2_153227_c0_seq1.p1 gnl/MRDRNA2_/MRDRNA2_153227_c0~~gnl/MRDRNA2_/MRDRNA2_153227_c0_seq1.p1  ORF type:complete len:298 (-),score=30.29 gnl/MRDRNA2_/MRDRNA2_153227_c0_seq1:58-924(-)